MADDVEGATGRWLSYAELAETRGTDKPSAMKLTLRKRWPRRKNNHGTLQICVPPEWLAEWANRKPATPPDISPGTADGMDIASEMRAAITAFRERSEADAATIAALRQELTGAWALAMQWAPGCQQAQQEAGQLRIEIEQLRQAEAARRGQGR